MIDFHDVPFGIDSTDLRIASATLISDVRGAFPNIDRRTTTVGRYENATAEKAVPFPSVAPILFLVQVV